jgi:8-oxo-dGTP pyrophosphatase MutT (NUDIX family)
MSKMIIASGPVIVENNQVLLNKHGADEFWKFCGGRIEDNEISLKEAAIREIKEEMGLEIEILNNDPYFFYTKKDMGGVRVGVILAHFLAKRIGEIKPGRDIREWRWINIDDLDKEDLAPNIKPVLKYFGF